MKKTIFIILLLTQQNYTLSAQLPISSLLKGTSLKSEICDWSLSLGLASFNGFYLANLKPFPKKPLLNTKFKPYLNQETVTDAWIYSSGFLINAAIFLLPNNQGYLNSLSCRHGKGFVKSCLVYTPLLTSFAKLIVGKKRPFYDDTIHYDDVDARKSFWSGHTSSSFSIVTYFNLYLYKHLGINSRQNLKWKIPVSLLLYSAASYVGWSRVQDHAHDYLDVVAAAFVGTGISIFVFRIYETRVY